MLNKKYFTLIALPALVFNLSSCEKDTALSIEDKYLSAHRDEIFVDEYVYINSKGDSTIYSVQENGKLQFKTIINGREIINQNAWGYWYNDDTHFFTLNYSNYKSEGIENKYSYSWSNNNKVLILTKTSNTSEVFELTRYN